MNCLLYLNLCLLIILIKRFHGAMDEVFSNEMSGICQKILSDLQFQNKQVIISITVLCINNIHIVNLAKDIKDELTYRKDSLKFLFLVQEGCSRYTRKCFENSS